MRIAIWFVAMVFWLQGAARAQTPPPDEVARCRAMDLAAQWPCFNALNEKMKRAAKPVQVVPPAPTPNPATPPAAVAAEPMPVCASLPNPQKRLSCYDAKFPPPPMPTSKSILPINN
jgi:hypothetical protein